FNSYNLYTIEYLIPTIFSYCYKRQRGVYEISFVNFGAGGIRITILDFRFENEPIFKSLVKEIGNVAN
ncbi:MAG: hypothetical protein LUC37_02720, partial [Prevotella sp.]|nr:hypothetical protein [Prevotella sp.]